jgi:hypothetical protein
MKTNEPSGYVLIAALIAVAIVSTLLAANRTPPSGWMLANRDRARWAMGTTHVYQAVASTTAIVVSSNVVATDYICGVVNLTDPTETQAAQSTCTPGLYTVTNSGTPWAIGEYYAVIVQRDQSDEGR